MNMARLKKAIFQSCGSAIIQSVRDNRISTWAGLQHNPWLPLNFYKDKTTVVINNREFMIDPLDWVIQGDGVPVMYKIKDHYRKPSGRVRKTPKIFKEFENGDEF